MVTYLECEVCGNKFKLKEGESIEDFVKCSCGGELRYLETIEDEKDIKPSKKQNKIKKSNRNRYVPYVIGIAITIIPIIFLPYLALITPILGGLYTSYNVSTTYRNGLKTGAIVGVLPSLLFLLAGLSVFIVLLIILTILGIIGGLIGTFILKKLKK